MERISSFIPGTFSHIAFFKISLSPFFSDFSSYNTLGPLNFVFSSLILTSLSFGFGLWEIFFNFIFLFFNQILKFLP